MIHSLVELLRQQGVPAELVTALISAVPIAELRGGIPAGLLLGLSMKQAFLWACLGNLLPVIPLLLFLDPVSRWLRRWPVWDRFFAWLFARTARKSELIRKYEAVGLAIFVAIPLPMTGAWTGCAAAFLFQLPFRLAFPAVAAGVLGAGVLVALAIRIGLGLFYAAL